MYKVILSACGNIDHAENPFENIVNGIKVKKEIAKCRSIEECKKVVCKYIDDHCLGGGNWIGGQVYKGNKQVGYISYNGRYWEMTDDIR